MVEVGGELMTRRRKRKRVFMSFDYDNDRTLKSFMRGQARHPDTPFEITDWSMKEAAPERSWEREARERIRRSDMLIVVAGRKTRNAPGVRKELKIAREEGVPVAQIIGYKNKRCPRVPNAGRRYRWTHENLKKLLG